MDNTIQDISILISNLLLHSFLLIIIYDKSVFNFKHDYLIGNFK